MGLDNTDIITDRSSEMLAAELKKRADLSKTKYSNVIAIASQEEITRQDGNVFRPLTSGEEKAFLAGIDPSELIKACEGDRGLTANQLDVDIMKILALTLEVAYGKEPPQSSWVTYDRDKRLLLLKLPPAKPIRYEELRDKRRGDVEALRAA
jgi:hypothetical protein